MSDKIEEKIKLLLKETSYINFNIQKDITLYNKLKDKSIYLIGEYNINIKMQEKIKEFIKSKYKLTDEVIDIEFQMPKDLKYNFKDLKDFEVLTDRPKNLYDEVIFLITITKAEETKKNNKPPVIVTCNISYITYYDASGNKVIKGGSKIDAFENLTLFIKYIN